MSVDPQAATRPPPSARSPRARAPAGLPVPDRHARRAARARWAGLPGGGRRRPDRHASAHSSFEILVDPQGTRAADLRRDRRLPRRSFTTSPSSRERLMGRASRFLNTARPSRPPPPAASPRGSRGRRFSQGSLAIDRRDPVRGGRGHHRGPKPVTPSRPRSRSPDRSAPHVALPWRRGCRLLPDDRRRGSTSSRTSPSSAATPPSNLACSGRARGAAVHAEDADGRGR